MKYMVRLKSVNLYSEFKFNKCLRQRNSVAPLLFNIVFETAIRWYRIVTWGTMCDTCSQIMA